MTPTVAHCVSLPAPRGAAFFLGAARQKNNRPPPRLQPLRSAAAALAEPRHGWAPLHRPLRPLAHRPAARRLAGGGAGQLARCTRPRRALAGAHGRRGHTTLRARGRPHHPGPARRAGPARGRTTHLAIAARRAVPAALDGLVARGLAYPCACTRRDIEAALATQGQPHARHGERVYPGTCRQGLQGRPARAWRLHTGNCIQKRRWPASMLSILLFIQEQTPRCTGPTGASARSSRTWPARWATSCCCGPTACGPTSSRWWSTTPPRA